MPLAPNTLRPRFRHPGLRPAPSGSRKPLLISACLHVLLLSGIALAVVPEMRRAATTARAAAPSLAPTLVEPDRPRGDEIEVDDTLDLDPVEMDVDVPLPLDLAAASAPSVIAVATPLARNARIPRKLRRPPPRPAASNGSGNGTASAPPVMEPVAVAPPPPSPLVRPVPSEDNRQPRYPRLAKRRGWDGVVVLAVHVAADGSVSDVEIAESSGHESLDEAARKAALEWTYTPAHRGDERVALVVRQSIRFVVPRG